MGHGSLYLALTCGPRAIIIGMIHFPVICHTRQLNVVFLVSYDVEFLGLYMLVGAAVYRISFFVFYRVHNMYKLCYIV